jgi:hypothetical protein
LALDAFTYYGYRGIEEAVRWVRKAGANRGYAETLGPQAVYAAPWLKRSGNWYVKLEVK